jgi:RNA polymerase sigma-70 factor, ECF subfamily
LAEEVQHVSDEQLARSAQSGDWASFDELVRRYEARIYRFVLSCGGGEANARDVTQETFVSAYQHLDKFDPARSLATWLFTIARRKCIDQSRRVLPVCVEVLPEQPDLDDPSVLVQRREAREDIWRLARRALPELWFQVVWLHYAEEMPVREIALVVRRTQPHVKVLLFRARRSLAWELERRAETERAQMSYGNVVRSGAEMTVASSAARE